MSEATETMKALTAVIFMILSGAEVYALHPRAIATYEEEIRRASQDPTLADAIALAEILNTLDRYMEGGDKSAMEIFSKVQVALLTIPGHAEYYRDRIMQAQKRFRERPSSETWSDYRDETGKGFQIFPHLPSPEGVRVLGDFLFNDWVPPGNETAPLSEKFTPLSEAATVALPKLPILNKPFKDPITQNNRADSLAAWQSWYEQIKAGKRTFRFEGDPTEYDLNGPAPGQKLAHISRDRKRDAEREAGRGKMSGSSVVAEPTAAVASPRAMPVALIIAGMVLLVSLGWYLLRGRKTA